MRYLFLSVMTGVSMLLAFLALSGVITDRDQLVLDKLSQSVVKVTNEAGTRGGTGFIFQQGTRTFTITNDHVCRAIIKGFTATRKGEFKLALTMIKSDPAKDLCALTAAPGLALEAALSPPNKFARIIILGHPGLEEQFPSAGRFLHYDEDCPFSLAPSEGGSCPEGSKAEMDPFQGAVCRVLITLGATNAMCYPGSSGSPVVNAAGRLVGVVNSINGANYAAFVPVATLKEFIGGL